MSKTVAQTSASGHAMTFPHTTFGMLVLLTQMPMKVSAALAGTSGNLLQSWAERTKLEIESLENLNERLARADTVTEASEACRDYWSTHINQTAAAVADFMTACKDCADAEAFAHSAKV